MDPKALQEEIDRLDHALAVKSAEMEALRGPLKAEIMELTRERDHLAAKLAAARKLANMSPAERAAVAALIRPAGVESQAKVGEPGK